jgi:hypothetical protein
MWTAKQENFQPAEKCFFLTSPFIELIGYLPYQDFRFPISVNRALSPFWVVRSLLLPIFIATRPPIVDQAKQQAATTAAAQQKETAAQMKAAHAEGLDTFQRAFGACMDARGYSVK